MEERLQKIMAKAGFGSRRSNETLIAAGRVTVNGKVARLGDKADNRRDVIRVDGKPITIEESIYVMLHKPKGVISSLEDELNQGRITVRDLVSVEGHIYPVGRLDKESEGLILLTNDGQMAHKLTHPRYGHRKVYKVGIEGKIDPDAIDKWQRGVDLDGKKTAPVTIDILDSDETNTWLLVTMREGRKRQIRRVAAMLGYPVTRLVRIQLGTLRLGSLQSGAWRYLKKDEIAALRRESFRYKAKRRIKK